MTPASNTASNTTAATRTEHDSLGDVEVPVDALWGAQTQRAIGNFDIGGQRFPLEVIHQLGTIKAAAGRVNGNHRGVAAVDVEMGAAIEAAARRVAAGEFDDSFPLDVLQTGSGTSSNMNVNEVIAHVASGQLGREVHPNDHVNAGQSSNDVMPTAIRMASWLALESVTGALGELAVALDAKGVEFADVVKLGRTHLMDAAPVLLGWEFDGWAAQIRNVERAVSGSADPLLAIPLGGTAVGTGVNVPAGWVEQVLPVLGQLSGLDLRRTPHAFVSQAGHDDLVVASGAVKAAATALIKVANDLRFMASGPFGGIAEIALPALQPGSSIMPGKVNPVICEAVVQAGYRVIGNDATLAMAASSGVLELNTAMPLMAWSLLESAGLVGRSARSLAERCVPDIIADRERCADLASRSAALVTGLVPVIGYEQSAKAAQLMMGQGMTIGDALAQIGVTAETVPNLAEIIDPARVARPSS